MKRLVDAMIKKWFCCHEWKFICEGVMDLEDGFYTVRYYYCKKCGKHKIIKIY